MVTLTKYLSIVVVMGFAACGSAARIEKQTPVSDDCKSVPKLEWQNESQGMDAETTLKLATELRLAAEADVAKSKELAGSASADLTVTSELAKVVTRNVQKSQSVTQDFWQQELTFRQILCYYDKLINQKGTPESVKTQIYSEVISMSKLRLDYTFEEKKRNGGTPK
ncbi:MAG: hypothetical protein H6590_03300 [Flavobacteriales bacterium]|nr:hypothetical protein [Flavobacteriales bacterium]